MKPAIRTLFASLLALATLVALAQSAQPAQPAATAPHTFVIEGDHFALDGKPFKILSGELHYARIPREYWHARLAQETAPLQIGRGGPILITQVENEYGSFAQQDSAPPDPTHTYMTHMRDIFVRAGFTASLLDTVDGGDQLPAGGIPGVFTG